MFIHMDLESFHPKQELRGIQGTYPETEFPNS